MADEENNKFIEVELRFPLLNPKEAITKMSSIGELILKDNYQKDLYFIPPHRNFLEQKPISEWLRIRKSDKRTSITYKNWHTKEGEKTVSCDEFETNITDDKALIKIFNNLNFEEIINVEKTRSTWNYKDTEIAIDKVTELGWFMELEAKGNFNNIDEAKQHLYKTMKELEIEVGPEDFVGYPKLILNKKEQK